MRDKVENKIFHGFHVAIKTILQGEVCLTQEHNFQTFRKKQKTLQLFGIFKNANFSKENVRSCPQIIIFLLNQSQVGEGIVRRPDLI